MTYKTIIIIIITMVFQNLSLQQRSSQLQTKSDNLHISNQHNISLEDTRSFAESYWTTSFLYHLFYFLPRSWTGGKADNYRLWTICLDNVVSSTSHNPIVLHGLLGDNFCNIKF
jgi:hypothetical protein